MKKFQNSKFVLVFFLISTLLFSSYLKITSVLELKIDEFNLAGIAIINQSNEYVINIDSIDCTNNERNNRINIAGWMFKKNVSVNTVEITIILRNTATNEFVSLPTTVMERPDVTAVFRDDNCNYNYSGFDVDIPFVDELDINKYEYEVYAYYVLNGTQQLVSFNTTINEWRNKNE